MKRLILMRHAKSSWDNLNLMDHDRVLNKRGHEGSKIIGTWLAANGFIPDQVIASTAERCVETWERTALAAGWDAPVSYHKTLYHAGPNQLLTHLQKAVGECVMLVAHNPGIAGFAEVLHGTNTPEHQKFRTYPTAATTIIDFGIANWEELGFGKGKGVAFATPRLIEDQIVT